MKLGIFVNYADHRMQLPMELIQHADAIGIDSVWTAEAYGSDAITPLAFIAAHTKRIRLATGIAQVSARAATMTAMQLATLDQLAGEGRVIAGLGLSGPQVVEGWYGQCWDGPYHRLRDHVAVLRKVWRGEKVAHDGRALQLPYQPVDRPSHGKPLRSTLHMNADIPIWLGTGAQSMVTLTAEIADGWIPMGFCPGMMAVYRPWLEQGFARRNDGMDLSRFEIQGQVQVAITDDVAAEIQSRKPLAALLVGGSGTREINFHRDQMQRRGFVDEAQRIQDLWLAGEREAAISAVPDEYIDQGALIGPAARIRERFQPWLDSGATGLTLHVADRAALDAIVSLL